MVGTFLEPSRGRRLKPIHSIPYSVAQPLERGSNNYYSIIQGGKQMGKPKKKKPQSKIDIFKTVVEILAGIANIVLVVYTILKG